MESQIDNLLRYYDKEFIEEKVEMDKTSLMGLHYDGLVFDKYLADSLFKFDYLDIEDYFKETAGINYKDNISLCEQCENLSEMVKIKVIAAILSLLKNSSYENQHSDEVITKTINYLERYGLIVDYQDEFYAISTERKLFEGSYSDILSFDDGILKKRLKPEFVEDEKWRKRFKTEYDNMLGLVESPHILKVWGYSEEENSYLMEKCDCDLYEYLGSNYLSIDRDKAIQIINGIIEGLDAVHSKGIIHRDLHLGNVLIKGGEVIISDFGLSKDVMVNHSFESSATPKNSNVYVDPVGLTDFRMLDKQSDIYSIGKIVEYVLQNTVTGLLEQVSLVIDKSTNRDRKKRYKTLGEFKADFESAVNDVTNEERIKNIYSKMRRGECTPDVEKYVLSLAEEGRLAYFIIEHVDYDFVKILIKMDESKQQIALNDIRDNYVDATGYRKFNNYDRFGSIMYNYILKANNMSLQREAFSVLEGCAKYRYKSGELYKIVKTKIPALLIDE